MRAMLAFAALMLPIPAMAQTLGDRVAAILAGQGPGTRFGLLVIDGEGREIVAIRPDDRFVPASNTKIFTTAAAYASLPAIDAPDATGGAAVRMEGRDVVLEGHGDARLSSAPDCTVDCLAVLADAVAARTRVVGDVIGDDSVFPDERWSPGMSWNNMPTRSGTGISALTLDDNEIRLIVTAGAAPGAPPTVAGSAYLTIDNRATTGRATDLGYSRMPGSRTVRITGTIAVGSAPQTLRLGIDDPADHTAWRLRAMLVERGVRVTGAVSVRHRPLSPADDPAVRGAAPAARPPIAAPLAKLVPPPIAADVAITNKLSQNLHAELLLRRIGYLTGSGSIADGQGVVRGMLDRAGVARTSYDFSDGSGMSSYNRVSPRAAVGLLRWTTTQPWGGAWRATLPVGGVDGTLRKRFGGTALDGKLFAKTGTLNAASALSGFLIAASGRTLIFSSFANDMPGDGSASAAVDAALELIASES